MKVIGIENKKGTFNKDGAQINYDYMVIHCAESSENTQGLRTRTYKIGKNTEIVGANSLRDILNREVSVEQGFSREYGAYTKAVYLRR